MNRTLYKILLRSKNSTIVWISYMVIGGYAGYLLWYLLSRYLSEPISSYQMLVSFLVIWLCTIVAIYQIPDQLCTNRYIKNVLYYPIPHKIIVSAIMVRIAVIQFGICIIAFCPQFFFFPQEDKGALLAGISCYLLVCIGDMAIVLISIIISRFSPVSFVGYMLIIFQYGTFLALALLAVRAIAPILSQTDILSRMREIWKPEKRLFWMLLIFVILMICLGIAIKYWYIRGYLNVQNFQYRTVGKEIKPTRIKNPYWLIEWKRVTRNKELVFFSNIKNLLTIVVLSRLLFQNFAQFKLEGIYVMEMLSLVSCCAVNTISSTAYSGDINRFYYAFLPISERKIFFWKTVQGFLFGELTVLLFWIGMILFRNIPAVDVWLLLAYGSLMNYACSWLGVFLDYKAPRMTNSTYELLHGNISKIIVLFVSIALTVMEIYLTDKQIVPIPLLPFAVITSICVVMIEVSYCMFGKGVFHD